MPHDSWFRYPRRAQFAETDTAGVAHFSCYLRYMEEAEHALWRAAGLRIYPPDGDLVFPRVSATVDFLAPLYFEDEFEVRIRVAEMTQRSIRYDAIIASGDTRVATGSMTVVCARRGTPLRAVEIPEAIRLALATSDGSDTRS